MQKNIQIDLPRISFNKDSTREFLTEQVFGSMGPNALGLAKHVLMFLKDRCGYGGHFEIDMSASVKQYVEQVPKNEWTVDATFAVYQPGGNGQHQFTIAIAQSRADSGPQVETNVHSYPTYLEGDLERNRQLARDGGKQHMDLNLFTSLRALMLGMASGASQIYLSGTMPKRAYNTFIIRDGDQVTRFTVSYQSTVAPIAEDDEAAINA